MAPSVGSSLEISAWKELAESCQHEIREKLYGNREYDFFDATVSGKSLLRKKIAYAMFGPAAIETLALSQKKKVVLSEIFNLVCTQSVGQKSFRVSFVYVECLTWEKMFYSTVIRLHLANETNEKILTSVFIDDVPRSYANFDDYLSHNRLPKCIMCYPATGAYFLQPREKRFQVKFRKSPACDIRNKIRRVINISFMAKRLVQCLRDAYCLFCPWYCKCFTTDGDMEEIRLRSLETRWCWLAIGDLDVSDPSVKECIAVRQAAQLGSKTARTVGNDALTVPQKVSGLAVINVVAIIVQKFFQGEPIAEVDLLYLVSASFLFSNVMLTTFHVNIFIKEMLNKGVKPENFLKELAIVVKERPECCKLANPNQIVNLVPLGMFFTLPKPSSNLPTSCIAICKLIAKYDKKYSSKNLSATKYAERIASELYEFWCAFGYEMQIMVEYFCEINGKKALCEVFDEIKSHDALEFTRCLVELAYWFRNQGGDKNALDRLARVIKFQEQNGTVKPKDGVKKYTEEYQQIGEILKTEFLEQRRFYQERFEIAKKFCMHLTESLFKDSLAITGSLSEHFCEQALIQMTKVFSNQSRSLKVTKKHLEPTSSGLKDEETGTTVHFFHGVTPEDSDQQLSRGQYFLVAREVVDSLLDNGASLEVDLESRVGFFRDLPDSPKGVTSVIVACVPENGVVAGHIFVVRCEIDLNNKVL